MKIFMASSFPDYKDMYVRFVHEGKNFGHILVRATNCKDLVPAIGCEIIPSDKERLMRWLSCIHCFENVNMSVKCPCCGHDNESRDE